MRHNSKYPFSCDIKIEVIPLVQLSSEIVVFFLAVQFSGFIGTNRFIFISRLDESMSIVVDKIVRCMSYEHNITTPIHIFCSREAKIYRNGPGVSRSHRRNETVYLQFL